MDKKTYDINEVDNYGNYCDFNRQNIGKTFSSIMFENKNNNAIKSVCLSKKRFGFYVPSIKTLSIDTELQHTSIQAPSYESKSMTSLRITNTGDTDAYIAIKDTSNNSDNIKSIEYNSEQPDKWIKKAGVWYYKEIIKSKDTIQIPINITNNINDSKISKDTGIDIDIYAIQKGAEIDFDSDTPWGPNTITVGKANTKMEKVVAIKQDTRLAYFTDVSTVTLNYSVSPNTSEVTGYSDAWKINNLYDIAGNMAEITAEKTGDNYIIRGGKYFNIGNNAITKREEISATTTDIDTGYRIALYVK